MSSETGKIVGNEINPPDTWLCPSCEDREYESYESITRHYISCGPGDKHFLEGYFGWRLVSAYNSGMSKRELAANLGISKKPVNDALESMGVEIRDGSKATKAWLNSKPQEERERIIYSGQDKAAKALDKYREENPEKHRQTARGNLPKPTHGPENHCWRGGKSFRDKLVRTYGEEWWQKTRKAVIGKHNNKCYMCGDSGVKLDVHHIVPVLNGGSNHHDNLIPLCKSCHKTVEWYTRNELKLPQPFID